MSIDLKKRKVEEDVRSRGKNSKIFSPFRIIGNVSNGVPFATGTLGSTFYIVTCVGKTFQIYDANTLHLLFVSEKETPSSIVALSAHFHYVYAAYENKVGIYKRGIEEHLLELETDANVEHLCIFGDYLCASTDDNSIFIYKKSDPQDKYPSEFYTKLTVTEIQGGEIVSLQHLATYLNKLTVVTKSNVLLFNVRTGKLVFTSNEFPDQITTAEPAPVLDIIALGTVTGEVIMFNMRKGKRIRTIKIPQSRISSLSFRTDGSSHLSVGTSSGDLIFYDLDRRSRIHVLKNIHRESYGGVTKATFLNGQPIIVTSGGDNSLKEYVFDPSLSQGSGDVVVQPPRYLRSRGGHSQPPSYIAFADSQSHFMLSASKDRSLWSFSLRKDAQSQEMSQRLHKKQDGGRVGGSTIKSKFPEIVALAIENARIGEWENIITAHKDEKFARTWDMRNKRVGRWTFDTTDDGFVKSVAMSQCGNFGFIGSSNGSITIYNMQSGILRKKYKLHKRAVTGISLDGMNRKMVSCGLDGIVGFYDFNKSTLLGKLKLDAPITAMVYHRSSDLFALALDDLSIVVIDAVTQRVVRQLWGHSNRITAFDFSPEGRWIVSTSLDSTIRTWDLPTGGCIDGIIVDNVATNVKFSPNGDLLATTHVTGNGICIWTNRAQFKTVSTRTIDESEFARMALPSTSVRGNDSMLSGALESNGGEDLNDIDFNTYTSLEQIDKELLTLSIGPRSKMNTLLHLDVIRKRSKPKEAPKKSEKLPFFLQLSGEKVGDEASVREGIAHETPEEIHRRDQEAQKKLDAEEQMNKFKVTGRLGFESHFTKQLREGSQSKDYSSLLATLINFSPAAVDLEIRSLNSFEPFDEIVWFIDALTQGLKINKNFELYETFMSLLFKAHGDVIHANNKNQDIATALQNWEDVHKKEDRLDDLVKFCMGVATFVTTA
ncbi:CGH_1_HP_G0136470.mRNA.1.CDS.1 [Saccharomyces cerevisiae]|nr:CGH_1_HP_G0027260.mRNA.1.CDS.1 [Saccharomyces cerevisiae]CAI4952298.1 CGH_1_HP_G0038730.mRNA.1.CDS.1 [Saccharomyces cerevisiae]CAI5132724.1 CGH_1_HP_G0136470.mRNA.1.CDS.1 [Saccharomyces cerevisiae]CAI6517681.1 CGH_1_HP_G0027260.mRNA.1.CDS.1 [Saccharomyces cerevisiae]CAI6630310.1 CGH_1_HP_G0038730.mRNA.1.CDS.1 [Saccharomyces cerevisiae]